MGQADSPGELNFKPHSSYLEGNVHKCMCTTLPTISSQSDLLIKVGNDFADSHAVPDVSLRDCNFTQGTLQQQLTISLAMVRYCDKVASFSKYQYVLN